MSRTRNWRTPIVVLLAGMVVLSLGIGIRQSFGLFLQPMSADLGWGREVFALAIAVQNLLWGLSQPVLGAVADRYGAGRVIAVSAVAYAAGIWLMAVSTTPLTLHLGGGLVVGLALSGVSFAVVLGAVGRAFPAEKRSAALGIASAGGSFGQFVMVPVGQQFIASYGWSTAFMLMAGLALTTALMAPVLAGRPLRPAGEAAGVELGFVAALREARRHSGYLYLTAGFFVCGFHVTFIGTHLPASLTDRGLDAGSAATALALIGLFNIFGSLGFGLAGGRWSKKQLLSLIYALRAVVILAFLLAPMTPWTAYAFAAGIGLLWLGTVPLTSALVGQIFGPRHLGMLFGLVFFSHQVGSFLGVWLGGKLFDMTGSYDVVWWIAILLGVLAAALHLPIDERPLARRAAAQPA